MRCVMKKGVLCGTICGKKISPVPTFAPSVASPAPLACKIHHALLKYAQTIPGVPTSAEVSAEVTLCHLRTVCSRTPHRESTGMFLPLALAAAAALAGLPRQIPCASGDVCAYASLPPQFPHSWRMNESTIVMPCDSSVTKNGGYYNAR